MMDLDLKSEDLIIQLRDKLNSDQVKLWLPPYYAESGGSCEEEMKKLAVRYSTELNFNVDTCLKALCQLQSNACERLQERDRFRETGVATMKVRLPGETRFTSLPIPISSLVSELQGAVATKLLVPPNRVKLISSGKVLHADMLLSSAGLQNGSQIMAVILHGNQDELQDLESNYQMLDNTKADARLLSSRGNDSSHQLLQIEDQSGKTLELPAAERQALVVAMSLHEKGRAAMKKGNLALALILFLEADREFSQCNSQLLDSVDNYAVLNLDIAWCYLCLKNVTQLPDAEKRLKQCEKSFQRSYGPNLERLMAIKGTTGNERALFMRLHLLQGIILFHQNKRDEATKLFHRAENELACLKVSDTSLASLLELGYTTSEARLGLRATNGDVNAAAERINRLRQERKQIEEENREKRRLGRCIDGEQWVERGLYQQLMSLGFTSDEARAALQNSNNQLEKSLELLQNKPELMAMAYKSFKVLPQWIQQVTAVGFDPRMARAALKKHFGDIERAVEELIASGGIIEGYQELESSSSMSSIDGEQGPSTSSNQHHRSQHELEQEAFVRLSEGMATSENDHLDLTLAQEEEFLKQYQALL